MNAQELSIELFFFGFIAEFPSVRNQKKFFRKSVTGKIILRPKGRNKFKN